MGGRACSARSWRRAADSRWKHRRAELILAEAHVVAQVSGGLVTMDVAGEAVGLGKRCALGPLIVERVSAA